MNQKILVDWTLALQDACPLETALDQVAKAYGFEIGTLVRWQLPAASVRFLAVSDKLAEKRLTPRLKQSCARVVLGDSLTAARDGSVWHKTNLDQLDSADSWMRDWCRTRGIGHLAIIVLECSQRYCDFLEIYLSKRLTPEGKSALDALGPSLSYAWARRRAGSIMRRCLRTPVAPVTKVSEPAPGAILEVTNPCGLSRSEYRVCILAGRGMSAREIGAELALTDSTVRSHLRNIYAKTGAHGQVALMYLLHGAPMAETPTAGICHRTSPDY